MATISLCMITKDEENNIAACLDSVKDFVDEMIVVDTGSKDRTVEIAKKLGAKVVPFKWIDDFAAARNESLKHATGDWILTIDADEVMAAADCEKIRELIKQDFDAFFLTEIHYTNLHSRIGWMPVTNRIKEAKKYVGFYPNKRIKLFKNNKDYRFEGAIHEDVIDIIKAKEGKIGESDVSVHHYGYANMELSNAKSERNLKIALTKLKKNPDSARAVYEAALEYKFCGDLKNAERYFLKAGKLDKTFRLPYNNLGHIYLQQNKLEDAKKAYLKSLEIYPDSDESSHNNLGVIYRNEAKYELSADHFRKAAKINPFNVYYYISLAKTLFKAEKYKDCLLTVAESLRRFPNSKTVYNNAGLVLFSLKKFDDAISVFEQGIVLDPESKELDNLKLYLNLGNCYIYAEKFSEAEKLLAKGIAMFPKAFALYAHQVKVLLKRQKYDDAIKVMEQGIAVDPTNNSAAYISMHFNLANTLRKKGMVSEAKQVLKRAISLKPTNVEPLRQALNQLN